MEAEDHKNPHILIPAELPLPLSYVAGIAKHAPPTRPGVKPPWRNEK